MTRGTLIAALVLTVATAAPAFANNGAVAYDAHTGRRGVSWHYDTQKKADAVALHDCNSAGCKIILRFGPEKCGALATTANGKGWTTAIRDTLAEARSAALADCEKRGPTDHCAVRGAECNR